MSFHNQVALMANALFPSVFINVSWEQSADSCLWISGCASVDMETAVTIYILGPDHKGLVKS